MFIGDGAKLVRDAFALAKEKAPAIIFIDELDAIGTKVWEGRRSRTRRTRRTRRRRRRRRRIRRRIRRRRKRRGRGRRRR